VNECYVSISRRGSFTGVKRQGRFVIQLPACSAEVHVWSCTSAPAACLREVDKDIFNSDLNQWTYNTTDVCSFLEVEWKYSPVQNFRPILDVTVLL